MKIKRLFSILIISLLTYPAFAQNKNFNDFDLDGDGLIETREFVEVYVKSYTDDWNAKDERGLDEEDFYLMTFEMVNVDDNNYLDANEYAFGYNYVFDDYLTEEHILYDSDDNGYLEYKEYFDALYDSDFFLSWDVDRSGYLDQYELAYAVFRDWDINNNYVINRSEFSNFDMYYLDI